MNREELPNGLIHLFGCDIVDTRTGNVYSEVIVKPCYERYFVEA